MFNSFSNNFFDIKDRILISLNGSNTSAIIDTVYFTEADGIKNYNFRYSFVVNTKLYQADDSYLKTVNKYRKGEKVNITYDTRNPVNSFINSNENEIAQYGRFLFFLIIYIIAIIWYLRKRVIKLK